MVKISQVIKKLENLEENLYESDERRRALLNVCFLKNSM